MTTLVIIVVIIHIIVHLLQTHSENNGAVQKQKVNTNEKYKSYKLTVKS